MEMLSGVKSTHHSNNFDSLIHLSRNVSAIYRIGILSIQPDVPIQRRLRHLKPLVDPGGGFHERLHLEHAPDKARGRPRAYTSSRIPQPLDRPAKPLLT
jgi:hypothetical protein